MPINSQDEGLDLALRARCTKQMKNEVKEYGRRHGNMSEGQVLRLAVVELLEAEKRKKLLELHETGTVSKPKRPRNISPYRKES